MLLRRSEGASGPRHWQPFVTRVIDAPWELHKRRFGAFGAADITERLSKKGFSRLQQSDNAQSRAMMNQDQFIQRATRGALQAVLVRQPEKS